MGNRVMSDRRGPRGDRARRHSAGGGTAGDCKRGARQHCCGDRAARPRGAGETGNAPQGCSFPRFPVARLGAEPCRRVSLGRRCLARHARMSASRASNGFGEAGAYVAGGATGRRPGRHGSARLVGTALPDGDRTYNARSGGQPSPLAPCMNLVTLSEEGNICASGLAVHHPGRLRQRRLSLSELAFSGRSALRERLARTGPLALAYHRR